MRIARIFAASMVLVAGTLAAAQTQLTLEQAVTTALEKSPVRKAAAFEHTGSTAGVKESRAALLPQINFTESFQRSNDPVFVFGSKLRQQRFTSADFGLDVLNTPRPFSNWDTRFSGGWQLFDSGTNWFRLRQARHMEQAAARKLERTEQELVLRVIEAYAGLLLAAKQQQVAEESVKTSQAILERTSAHVQAGMVVESDLLSAQVNDASRQEELIRARNAVALARARLNHEMGMPLETNYLVSEALAEKQLPSVSLETAEQQALERRPDLQEIELQKAAQSESVRMAKAAFGPKLNAFADWQLDNPRLAGGGGNNWMAGFELRVDLFDGGSRMAQLQRERAAADRMGALRENAASGIRLEVRKAYLDLDAARQQVEVARAAVGQGAESLRIMRNRYESGLSTITDLLRVEEANVRAQTQYWQSVYSLHTSYANLELATGTLGVNSAVIKP